MSDSMKHVRPHGIIHKLRKSVSLETAVCLSVAACRTWCFASQNSRIVREGSRLSQFDMRGTQSMMITKARSEAQHQDHHAGIVRQRKKRNRGGLFGMLSSDPQHRKELLVS